MTSLRRDGRRYHMASTAFWHQILIPLIAAAAMLVACGAYGETQTTGEPAPKEIICYPDQRPNLESGWVSPELAMQWPADTFAAYVVGVLEGLLLTPVIRGEHRACVRAIEGCLDERDLTAHEMAASVRDWLQTNPQHSALPSKEWVWMTLVETCFQRTYGPL